MNKVICNKCCQQEFKLTELNTNLVEQLSNDIEHYYIECPNCKQQYTSYYLDDDLKVMQQEIRRLQKRLPVLKVKQKNKLTKLKRKILFMQNQLKMKVEQGT
ncbi:hypothetical protein ACLIBH_12340 [Virgibacillus sp. W0430]|uniref:hypothetical protein n=1 Tax=Virgibacillus sp. W0430 TaxID=3391580 RepID=UPI003F478B53